MVLPEVLIRPARPAEAEHLSDLALRSKAHWDYSPEFIEACREELTITSAAVTAHPTFVAELEGTAIGFYVLQRLDRNRVELADLFVEPAHIGTGVGRVLMDHAISTGREHGYTSMIIQADPNAEPFYRRAGASTVATRPSESIPGRDLPLMELPLRL